MYLTITGQFIRSIIEEGLQTTQETIHITLAYLTHKALDFIRRLADAYRRIVRKQETEKPLLHLTVRKTEGIVLKLRVIVLDGQITALIDDRYRIGRSRIDGIQHRTAGYDVFNLFHRIMMKFHQLYQVSWGTRLKPIAAYLFLSKGIQQTERIVHAYRLIAEMITVVVFLQQFTSFGIIYA